MTTSAMSIHTPSGNGNSESVNAYISDLFSYSPANHCNRLMRRRDEKERKCSNESLTPFVLSGV